MRVVAGEGLLIGKRELARGWDEGREDVCNQYSLVIKRHLIICNIGVF